MAIEAVELELPDAEDLETPFKRRVALLVVIVTLLGSLVAYLETQASTRQDQFAREAQRSAVSGLSNQVQVNVETTTAYGIYALAQQYERRRVVSAQRARLLQGTPQQQAYAAEAERWANVKSNISSLTPLLADEQYTPQNDPSFPNRFDTDRGEDSDVTSLRQRAQSETSDAWSGKASRYVAVITLLAVVLFLLGLSLTIGGRVRYVFVAPAVLILAWGAVDTGRTALAAVPSTPDLALRRVAEGRRLQSQGDYDGAVGQFTEAINLRSDYAVAYGDRAGAYFLKGSSQVNRQFVSITAPGDLALSIADGERAVSLGANKDINIVGNLGNEYFLAGRYDEAARLTDQAIALNDHVPSLWLNSGVINTAKGDAAAAGAAYDRAIGLTNSRPDKTERNDLYSAGRTDLEILAQVRPERADLIRTFEGRLTRAQAEKNLGFSASNASASKAANFSFDYVGSSVVAHFDASGLPPDARLAYIWYVRSGPGQPWNQDPFLDSFELAGESDFSAAVTTTPRESCPVPGDYRIDVVANGVVIGSGVGTRLQSPLGLFVPYDDQVLGLNLCRPAAWTVNPDLTKEGESFSAGNSDDTLGVEVNVFTIPPDFSITDTAQIESFLIKAAGGDHPTVGGQQDFTFAGLPGRMQVFDVGGGSHIAVAVSVDESAQARVLLMGAKDADPILATREIVATITFT